VQIAGGAAHFCGLTAAGAAYCWGYGEHGSVGNGTNDPIVAEPAPVSGGLSFEHLALGVRTSCGITGEGISYCWGDNGYGELGIGLGVVSVNTPQVVADEHSFEILAPGYRHTCGIRTDGATYCWGDNYEGGLGDGGVVNRTYVPIPTLHF
jgi:alpha-tubulin suppressor-like RCC1 family protein